MDTTPSSQGDLLVVDDDKLIRVMVSDQLREAGFKVEQAANGAQALELLAAHDYDALVCDLHMPELDGFGVLSAVREDYPETEVVILTGKADLDAAIQCLRLGAFDLVRKEHEMPELVPSVQRALERRALRDARSLHAASQVIFSASERQDLPERIVRVATQVMDADDASLMLTDINDELYIAFSNGLPEHLQRSTRILVGEGIAGRVAAERAPTILNGQPSSDERFTELSPSRHRAIRSSLIYPLCAGDRVLGVLNLNRVQARRRPFREQDYERAALLSSQILLSLENQHLIRRVTAADKFTAVGQLSTAIAHEINNPITFLLGGVAYVQEELEAVITRCADSRDSPESQRCFELFGGEAALEELCAALGDAREGAVRIRDVVRDLRSMVRGDPEARAPFDLNSSIQAAQRISAAELHTVAATEFDLGADLMVEGSRGTMSQVFVNLFMNAGYAMREAGQTSGKLTVTTRREDDRVLIEVADTGPGIPAEQLARIFEPFFTTKPVGVGTGLGLSTCQEIVAWHGGEMRVRSVVGEGTSFKISLPAVQSEQAATPQDQPDEAAPPTMQGEPGRPRILLIDDEPAICRSVVRALREYAVVTASSGPEALVLLEADTAFSLVICDVVMPEMSGVDLFRQLEQQHAPLSQRFVFVTGSVGYANVQSFAQAHGIPVLEKPFSVTAIRELIEAHATK